MKVKVQKDEGCFRDKRQKQHMSICVKKVLAEASISTRKINLDGKERWRLFCHGHYLTTRDSYKSTRFPLISKKNKDPACVQIWLHSGSHNGLRRYPRTPLHCTLKTQQDTLTSDIMPLRYIIMTLLEVNTWYSILVATSSMSHSFRWLLPAPGCQHIS